MLKHSLNFLFFGCLAISLCLSQSYSRPVEEDGIQDDSMLDVSMPADSDTPNMTDLGKIGTILDKKENKSYKCKYSSFEKGSFVISCKKKDKNKKKKDTDDAKKD